MNIYNLEMKYIKNKETFVFSVLACILKEIEKITDRDRERRIQALARVSTSYLTILKFQNNPNEILNTSYDALELASCSMPMISLQENVDKLVNFFDDPIVINLIGGEPSYKDDIMADFKNFIIFR